MKTIDPTPVTDELEVLAELVHLPGANIIELGCGSARLARKLLQRYPDSQLTGLEVDARQHAKNLLAPQERLHFVAGGAQAMAFPDASFDLALMLKSLHHVPIEVMAQALAEVARVLRPGGHLYVSEPVYAGVLNDIVKLYNDEGLVRAAAQAALDSALASTPHWQAVTQRWFDMPASWSSFDAFEQRMMRPSFADHQLDAAKIARVRAAFEPHCGPQGAQFMRPMHVRLLRRTTA
ncbi:class I SAM-dependent methyltransferase [Rhodoferax sp.]|uniref:class I SAM-dependent methyltransferase n=1 Tax=Rhodoferax sp. TaxID=50421 RepID=UPI00261AC6EB|nr:class I SAM-dependent methyltransferase [Rhodoferax sp.]MDD2924923.1 methyltransferase domain-containing protein [Rhodoferax sp.]